MAISLNPFPFLANATINSVSNVFGDIWAFLLYNLISPLLIIGFIVLFFGGQYYLLKLYVYVVETGFKRIYTLFEALDKSERFKKVIEIYKNALK